MEQYKVVEDIRTNWAIGDAIRDEGLTTPEDIRRFDNISYGSHGTANLLDIYVKDDATGIQPTIFNIHGGGWVYGSKELYQYYCMNLAMKGFTVVNINYRLSPENIFPAAIEDINAAMTFVAVNGKDYYVDKDRMIIVGDSAGGQLTSQYATILTNPDYASLLDIEVPDVKVKAVGLNCGLYDAKTAVKNGKDELLNIYLGIKQGIREVDEALLNTMDVCGYMTGYFPPAFVMSSENDFLLEHAKPMYEHLLSLGVPAKLKIYGSKDRPDIAHVFHINCKLEEADICNTEECEFFNRFICESIPNAI